MQSFIAIAHSYPKLYRGGGIRPPPPSQKSSKKPILNRVKYVDLLLYKLNFMFISILCLLCFIFSSIGIYRHQHGYH